MDFSCGPMIMSLRNHKTWKTTKHKTVSMSKHVKIWLMISLERQLINMAQHLTSTFSLICLSRQNDCCKCKLLLPRRSLHQNSFELQSTATKPGECRDPWVTYKCTSSELFYTDAHIVTNKGYIYLTNPWKRMFWISLACVFWLNGQFKVTHFDIVWLVHCWLRTPVARYYVCRLRFLPRSNVTL